MFLAYWRGGGEGGAALTTRHLYFQSQISTYFDTSRIQVKKSNMGLRVLEKPRKKLVGFIKALSKRKNDPRKLRDDIEVERIVRRYRLCSFKFTAPSKIQ